MATIPAKTEAQSKGSSLAALTTPKEIPDMAELCLNVPLYESFQFNQSQKPDRLRATVCFKGHFDSYCIQCQRTSTFHCVSTPGGYLDDNDVSTERVFGHVFSCTRSNAHSLHFIFKIEGTTITKIGQHPSIADISKGEIDRYRKPLGSQRFSEFSRAIGLAAHGVGIGAFIYLRRVFEFLIDDAYKIAKATVGWNDDAYMKARVGERIEMLSAHLPSFLVENRGLYGIMSKGVHSLTEEGCLEAFPVVKVAIELILDQRIESLQREEKLAKIKKDLNTLNQKLA